VAVSVAVCCPAQIVAGDTLTTGFVTTVTVATALFVQPFTSVAVMVYEVVEAGFAVTLDPVVPLKPVPGLHA
jgi:hypothetical protein